MGKKKTKTTEIYVAFKKKKKEGGEFDLYFLLTLAVYWL